MKLERGQRVLLVLEGRFDEHQAVVMGHVHEGQSVVLQMTYPLEYVEDGQIILDPDFRPEHREALYDPVEAECNPDTPEVDCSVCGGYHRTGEMPTVDVRCMGCKAMGQRANWVSSGKMVQGGLVHALLCPCCGDVGNVEVIQ